MTRRELSRLPIGDRVMQTLEGHIYFGIVEAFSSDGDFVLVPWHKSYGCVVHFTDLEILEEKDRCLTK